MIVAINVAYTGENEYKPTNLVIYQNIFDGKFFAREADTLFSELSEEKQEEFGQTYRVQALTRLEARKVKSRRFRKEKAKIISLKNK